MKTFKKIFSILCATIVVVTASDAQDVHQLFASGLSLEQHFQDSDALVKYTAVLSIQPDHADALSHASRMLSNMAGRMNDHDTRKKECVERSHALALRAIHIDKRNKEAHLNYIIALGLLTDVADSPKEKIAHARTIKEEADLLLQLDPGYAPAFFILGKWNLSLARLTWVEKLACEILFDGVPEGVSFKNAIRYFDRAVTLQPDYILFHYNLALAYYYTGNYEETRRSLDRAFTLPQKEPDDIIRLELCSRLLQDIKTKQL